MKKSEFKKLKVGDTVTLRTLDELKLLRCYFEDDGYSHIVDDCGLLRDSLMNNFTDYLGGKGVVVSTGFSEHSVRVNVEHMHMTVVRQHLKGVSK